MTEETIDPVMPQMGDVGHPEKIAALMGWFFLRHLGRIYREFDGDFVLAIVLGEIAHHNVCRFFSHGKPLPCKARPDFTSLQASDELTPCNAFSLSAATGIPRETIRRKIAQLVDMGMVKKHISGGYVILPGLSREFDDINFQTLQDFLATSDELRRILAEE